MKVTVESYGFNIEIMGANGSSVELTFEEVRSNRTCALLGYECYVDFKNHVSELNAMGRIVTKYKVTKSLVIKDWFNSKTSIRSRNYLRSKLGVSTYNKIVSYANMNAGKGVKELEYI